MMPGAALLSTQFDATQGHASVPFSETVSSVPNGVIVADDDAVLRDFLRAILTRAGHNVSVARDGVEAFELAHDFPASLTILDIHMPRLDGLIACRMICRLPGYQTRPIVMLTVDGDPETWNKAVGFGADQVLTKPFHIDSLLQNLAAYITIPETLRDTSTRQGAVPPIANGVTERASTVTGSGKVRSSRRFCPPFSDAFAAARRDKRNDAKLK